MVCAQGMDYDVQEGECKFCKLELVYRKDNMVDHLGYQNNNGKMWGVALCQHQGPVIKAIFSRCYSVWPASLDEVLDDYVTTKGTM